MKGRVKDGGVFVPKNICFLVKRQNFQPRAKDVSRKLWENRKVLK